MTVAAAIRITSADEDRVIKDAVDFARQQNMPCFVIAIVSKLPYGEVNEEHRDAVVRNLELIAELEASPVMKEGSDIATSLLAVAQGFGVRTMFLQSGTSRLLGRSIAEQLLYLNPPFDVVVVSSE